MSKLCVIGGGLVGLAVARELRNSRPDSEVVLLEKEPDFGVHQSTHNSGVLHAGLYYKPGSLKARLAVEGIRKMVDFCQDQGVRHEKCGKLVIATDESELGRLRTLLERGEQNGLRGLRWLEREALREIEPHAAGIAAVHVPEEGIVDYRGVCDALVRENRRIGSVLHSNTRVSRCLQDSGKWRVVTNKAEVSADYIVNCAGLHCDRVAQSAGEHRDTRIVPFRGEYYRLKPSAEGLVKHLIYPVPDPKFPFLGVHFTRLVDGGREAGPNAVLAFAREGYTKWKINPNDLADALLFKGLWKFLAAHKVMAWEESKRSFSRKLFCRSLQRLVPEITESDLAEGGAGVRAQAMDTSGQLVQDFTFIERPNALHLINAPSPAATASLAIATEIVSRIPKV